MTNSETNFEHQLRQLTPTSCDERLPQTFYRAGWEACARTNSRLPPERATGQWPRSFVSGLLCGLLVAVGVSGWPQWSNDSEPRQQMVAPELGVSEPALADASRTGGSNSSSNESDFIAATIASEAPVIDWTSLTSAFFPWAHTSVAVFADPVPAAARPLSIAARQHWSCVVVAEQRVSRKGAERSAGGAETAATRSPLTTFPASEERLRELL